LAQLPATASPNRARSECRAVARAEDGDIARRVAHAVLLLERGIVLLVDDDQAEARQRRENRQPGAEHDARLAGKARPPVALARRFGQFAVQADTPVSGKRARPGLRAAASG
jgi:hypothetical protein